MIVKRLNLERKKIFLMSLEGATSADIAEALKLTQETVFVLRSKVKQGLKKEIEKIRRHIEL